MASKKFQKAGRRTRKKEFHCNERQSIERPPGNRSGERNYSSDEGRIETIKRL